MQTEKERLQFIPHQEFAKRWKATRLGALKPFLLGSAGSEDEIGHLSQVDTSKQTQALEAVETACRNLGEIIRSEMGSSCTLNEIIELVSHSDVPCFMADWKREKFCLSRYRVKGYCNLISGVFGCDYWREAIRGLVSGLAGNIEFARHRSLGHGDLECFDVLYTSPGTDRRWGVVPSYIARALSTYTKLLNEAGLALFLQGYSEGVLFYRLEGNEVPLCGEKREVIIHQFELEARRFFSDIKVVDVTPQTILEGSESRSQRKGKP